MNSKKNKDLQALKERCVCTQICLYLAIHSRKVNKYKQNWPDTHWLFLQLLKRLHWRKFNLMKTYYLLLLLWSIYLPMSLRAQVTLIPEINFEQALVNQGIDTDGLNGQILNSDAAGVAYLNIDNENTNDLTGISAFVNLTGV